MYQQNSNSFSWTVYPKIINTGYGICSIVVNSQGSKLYVTAYSLLVYTFNGSQWLKQTPTYASDQFNFAKNVYLTKDEKQLWIHGTFKNGSVGICFYNSNWNTFVLNYCITSTYPSPLSWISMYVSPN